ncbi:Equilibrative nucleoside transporter protein [Phaffia rhodozyma]|uniref:Equilibrative nucleoside transporter protein n=1 Tax=Phaffia rhodozyma TaxID=264483 RepID=A0A0F7SLI9_PHARH|nr:Equilibrative nucleoside transporter protein [Phaffia rhodozyma]
MSNAIQSFGKGALRVAKNYTKGYSDTQMKVREATSNDAWGPSGTQMNDVAQLTFNQNDFVEVMEMLDKRLNDKGKNWRHVFKALTVLDYILHSGSENVVIYFKDNLYIIKTLKEFVYVDEDGKDVGANVRQKAKDITNLLMDDSRLKDERRSRGAMQDRMTGSSYRRNSAEENENFRRREDQRRPSKRPGGTEDDDLQRAIRASLVSDDDGERKRRANEEDELAKVLALSEREEAQRKRDEDERIRKLDEQTSRALFDDSLQLDGPNAYQQQPQVDLFAQQTGFQQPQQTGWNSQFNPFYQQQMMEQQQREAQAQQQYMQMQYQAQQEQLAREQAAAQQAFLFQQQQQQQQLFPQPTGYGSNNPFAAGFTGQQQAPPPMPTMSSFNSNNNFPVDTSSLSATATSFTPSSPANVAKPVKNDGENSRLAMLLANGRDGGLDTFGNVGNLRMPAHYGGREGLVSQQTGANNPFGVARFQQQQQQQRQPPTSGNLVDF